MSSAPRHVLAIDLGTSGPKVALVSEHGELTAAAARQVVTRFIPPDGAEQDPAEIWQAIRGAVHEVMYKAQLPRTAIAAVACTSQYFSVVPAGADGQAVGPLIVWMDTRGGRHSMALHASKPGAFERWIELHGIPPLPSGGDSLSKVLWIREERPEIWERARYFLEPVDWILMRLSGRATSNVCTAFPFLLTDNRRLDALEWSPELVETAGIDAGKLPELVPPNTIIGRIRRDVAEDLGLPPEAKIVSGVNDTQAAAIATATFRPQAAAINVGTTGQAIVHLDGMKSEITKALVSMPSPVAGRYMLMAENGIAAKALDHFLGKVIFFSDALADHSNDAPFAGVEAAVGAAPPGAGGVLFLPWLTGTVAPDANSSARGAFVNLSLESDRPRLVRAVLEGVAYSMRGLLPEVEQISGVRVGELRFSGGGARSDAWAQILADVLNRPILPLADPVHSNNRASALLAFEALGIAGFDEVDRFCPQRRRFEPRNENRAVYDHLFAQFEAAYDGLRPVFDALNRG